MAINLDHVTEQITVTDTATNADLTLVTKGTGSHVFNTGNGTVFKATDNSVASIVNYTLATGSNSGGAPVFGVAGTDTNAGLNITSKGTGAVTLRTGSSAGSFSGSVAQFNVAHTASAVNYIQATGQPAGFGPLLTSQGSDTNINMVYMSKGTGGHGFGTGGGSYTQQLFVSHTASAVNSVNITGAATGSGPTISAQGSDTNVNLFVSTKGTGALVVNTAGGYQFTVVNTSSSVNWLEAKGGATGSGPQVSAVGTDTNIDLNVTAKGTGGIRLNVGTASKYTYVSYDASTNAQLVGAANTANLGIYATGGGSIRFYTATGLLEEQLRIAQTASAVNYVQVTGAVTGGNPAISTQGSDSNIGLGLASKGVAAVASITNGKVQFDVFGGASAVNYIRAAGANTGFGPVLQVLGSDTNIPLVLQPKGTGALQAQQTDSTATGGNARGAYAIDFQTARGTAAQVANGTLAVITGGQNNTSSGLLTTVSGGFNNTSSGNSAFVGGGQYNVASELRSVAVGGGVNTSAGMYNFVGGGFTNSGTSGSAVTTQSATMNGTTAVTLSGSNANIKVGQYISGTSIAADTYVAAISGTSLTLSQAATGSSTSTLGFYTPHGVVVGGGNNQATGSYSFIGGGGDAGTAANRNVASGAWSVVCGGTKNTASGSGAFVGGGGTNGSVTLPNSATADGSVVVGGFNNTASGFGATVSGGFNNVSNGGYSNCFGGSYGSARGINSNNVFSSSGPIAGLLGASQAALLILGVQTTDATATVLRSDTSAASGTNQVILANNSAYFFTGEVVAGVTGGGNTKGWTIEGVIKRGANAASTALVGTPTVTSTYADAGASTWVIAVTADTTNGGLAVTFTGQLATTIRVVAKISTTEMTF